ncbi:MAG: T9SS type A sorting domain-containing protein [Ignavibacteria bacterium]|nr:T9SS type A sorting domain-containing protein [Ignavibacteria bacterium]
MKQFNAKHFNIFFALLAFIFICGNMINSQNIEASGDMYRAPGETNNTAFEKSSIPSALMQEYQAAKLRRDNDAKERLGSEIQKYLPMENTLNNNPGDMPVQQTAVNPPFNPDWYSSDVMVHSGAVAYSGGFRQVDLKQGEDGWMYMAVNRRPTGSVFGSITVYRSSNGGATWATIGGLDWASRYIQSVSMLVENRSNTNFGDSTKIALYYVTSATSNFNDARLESLTMNRNGANWNYNLVSTPAAGNKYEYPSSCSDGMYWGTATYLHCVVREASNAGVQVGLRHFLSTNWAETHTSALINTGWNDFYPNIQYGEKNTGTDSIYIAAERRFAANEYGLRLIATSEFVSANHFTYFVAFASGVRYEKPELTVVQQYFSLPRKMLITCTRDRNPRFFYSTNGAQTWVIDQLMGTSSTVTADFTTCSSDSLTSGGQYVIMGFVTDDGDSVNVKQLSIPPSTTYAYYKRNTNVSSGLVAPTTSIYKVGGTKYAAFGYPGSGPTNVFYNAEQLVTAIEPISSNTPDKFALSQNYPNPFNPVTNINFSLPNAGNVRLVVFDMTGREVAVLVNGQYSAGTYKVDYNASSLASGVYFYKLETESFTDVKKMMLIK